MSRFRRSFIGLASLAVLVGLITAVTPGSSVGQQGNKPPTEVSVINTPLPVTGNIGLTGAVSATQSGPWSVEISGTPSVVSVDETVLIGSFEGTVPGGNAFTQAVNFQDASWAKSIRVMTNCFDGGACANILVRVYTVVGGRSYLIEQFPMQNFQAATRVYEVLGATVTVQLLNQNAGANSNIGVAVFGRAN